MKGERHVTHHRHEAAQPGRPDGPLEREPLEDSHLRLAGPRRRRLRHRRHGRHEEPRPEHRRSRRVGPDGPDPARRLQAAGGRERLHPEPHRHGRHARVRRGREGRRRPHLARGRSSGTSARRSPPATPTRSRRTGTPRSSASTSAARSTRRRTRSGRSSTPSPRPRPPIPASSSARWATPVRRRRSWTSTARISARPGCSPCRSR